WPDPRTIRHTLAACPSPGQSAYSERWYPVAGSVTVNWPDASACRIAAVSSLDGAWVAIGLPPALRDKLPVRRAAPARALAPPTSAPARHPDGRPAARVSGRELLPE